MLVFIVAIAPAIALIVYFYQKDKYEKEPLKLLLKAFFAGVVVTFLAIFIERFLMLFIGSIAAPMVKAFFVSFLVAALVEEGVKFCAFRFLIYGHKEFNEPYDGILYAVMISLGFATLENIMYVLSAYLQRGFVGLASVGAMRGLFAVPGHALFAVIMGYYFGLAKFSEDRTLEKRYMYQGLGLAVFFHGTYDFFLIANPTIGIIYVIPLLICCWYLTSKVVKEHLENSPFKNKK